MRPVGSCILAPPLSVSRVSADSVAGPAGPTDGVALGAPSAPDPSPCFLRSPPAFLPPLLSWSPGLQVLPPAPAIGLPSWLGPAITLLLWPGQPATLTGCSGEGMLPGEQGRGAVNPPSSSSSPRGIRKEGPVTLFPPPTQLRIHRESGVLGAQTSGRNRAPPPSPAWAPCGQLVSEALVLGTSQL